MFQQLQMAPADPILGLMEAFQQDPRTNKINLGVGVYQDDAGRTPVLECVKQSEQWLVEQEPSKSYLGIAGHQGFVESVQRLLWPISPSPRDSGRVVTLQTPGGTAALRVAADFVATQFPHATVWLSEPTWANHPGIFQAAGLKTATYRYLDQSGRQLTLQGMLQDLQHAPAGDLVLLHGCCHNPSGIDPGQEQWRQLAEFFNERQLLPLVDFAYQGFGEGLMEDTQGLQILTECLKELLVASSYSKNFGLYSERVGALSIISTDRQTAQVVLSQVKRNVRTNYSNPPAHGAAVVDRILNDRNLRQLWEKELTQMRERIQRVRNELSAGIARRIPEHDFSFMARQRGMFSFSGLTPPQVDRLRDQFAIYMVRSGRINVAGISSENMDQVCDAIAAVVAGGEGQRR